MGQNIVRHRSKYFCKEKYYQLKVWKVQEMRMVREIGIK